MTELAIEARGLVKSYRRHKVLTDVDLFVARGTVHALLGPNGAGKTTLVRILATLSAADRGTARVAGFDVVRQPRQVRRSISLTGQYVAVDEAQTGLENLWMMGRLAGLSRVAAHDRAAELLDLFDLVEAGRRRTGTYSGGMRRRLDLAASLVVRPVVLFLDEPTTGLDLAGRHAMWRVIADVTASGTTVLLTTQYLDEADRVADRIAVLDRGRVIADGSAGELKAQVAGWRLDLTAADRAAYETLVRALGPRATHDDPAARTIGIPTDGSAAHVRALLDELDPARTTVRTFAVHSATLDDVFLALTGHAAQPGEVREVARV